jgi:hypothetical protein
MGAYYSEAVTQLRSLATSESYQRAVSDHQVGAWLFKFPGLALIEQFESVGK